MLSLMDKFGGLPSPDSLVTIDHLRQICRFCGKWKPERRMYPKSTYEVHAFYSLNIELSKDDPTIHPPKICETCRARVYNWKRKLPLLPNGQQHFEYNRGCLLQHIQVPDFTDADSRKIILEQLVLQLENRKKLGLCLNPKPRKSEKKKEANTSLVGEPGNVTETFTSLLELLNQPEEKQECVTPSTPSGLQMISASSSPTSPESKRLKTVRVYQTASDMSSFVDSDVKKRISTDSEPDTSTLPKQSKIDSDLVANLASSILNSSKSPINESFDDIAHSVGWTKMHSETVDTSNYAFFKTSDKGFSQINLIITQDKAFTVILNGMNVSEGFIRKYGMVLGADSFKKVLIELSSEDMNLNIPNELEKRNTELLILLRQLQNERKAEITRFNDLENKINACISK